jgi:NAD(P)-dependent dehydrogenase (short-subunit alcohol dehydrogenase family)
VSSLAHRWGKIKKDDLNSERSYSETYNYAQSKLANILFTRELARRLEGTKVTVNALHPGTINTELSRHIGKISLLFNKYLVKPFLVLFFKTPKAGAQTTLYAGNLWEYF